MNLSRYNLLLFLLYLFLCAYNFVFYVTYNADNCIQTVAIANRILEKTQNFLENPPNYQNYQPENHIRSLDNTNNSTTTTTSNSSGISGLVSNATQQLQSLLSSVQLTKVPLGMAIMYLIMSLFSLLASCAINWFSHMLPEKFSSLGFFKGSIGCFIRNNPKLMRLIHYVLLILIVTQFALIFGTSACKKANHVSGETVTVGEMWDQSIVFNIVTLCFWGAMHCGFPFIKQILPQEAFIFEPYDSDYGIIRYICCSFLGPN